ATKHTGPGGHVEVRARRGTGRLLGEVEFDGIGTAPEYLEPSFEPFTRVGRDRTGSREGSGLGLAISRQLARAMEGELHVESELGKGSTFTLVLPGGR